MTARYSTVAIALHWLTALSILAMIPMGWWMSRAITDPESQATAYRVFQLHKSIGLTILMLTVLRIGWRLAHRAPPLPETMNRWEAFLARATQFAFYALLLALPLTGWLYVSTGWAAGLDRALNVATSWFGLLPVPHLPGIHALGVDMRRTLAFGSIEAHSLLAWGAVILVALHAGAALKHHFIDRDHVLRDMLPRLPGKPEAIAAERVEPISPAEPLPADPSGLEATQVSVPVFERLRQARLPMTAGMALTLAIGTVGWMSARPTPLEASAAPPTGTGMKPPSEQAIVRGTAQAWIIDRAESSIQFSGTHAGTAFKGRFEGWEGDIWFDRADLDGSRAVITVRTGSARTGDATQEGSLQDPEWFDPAGFPTARFSATDFRALGGDRFEAQGTLRIKDRSVPVVLPFTFQETGETAVASGTLTLDRTALDLGMASDAAGDWVSRSIVVTISVQARRDS